MRNVSHFRHPVLFFCLVELGLLALGVALTAGLSIPVQPWLGWKTGHATIGIVGTLPTCALLAWLMKTSWRPVVEVRQMVDLTLKPLFGRSSVAQLALLAVLAGVAEEYFFRAFLQTFLGEWLGPVAGLILASLVFGVCHLATWFYGIFAAVLGSYLGVVMLYAGSVWPSAIIHALYDFVALMWLCKVKSRSD